MAIALGDLNGDGALDLATANNRSYNVSVALGVGDGTFQEVETFTAGNTHSVVLVDLDGDGHLIY